MLMVDMLDSHLNKTKLNLFFPRIIDELFGKSFDNEGVFKRLCRYRNLIAHYSLTRGCSPSYISFDNINASNEITILSNLLERMVTYILRCEFDLLSKCDENYKKMILPFRELFDGD